MSELTGVVIAAAFVLGWFLALRLIRSNTDIREAAYNAAIKGMREDAAATLATLTAYADARVAVMEQAANVLLKAAHTERAAADALTNASTQIAALSERVGFMQQVVEALDANQGAILTSLVNMGAMQATGTRRRDERQYGEPDPQVPPLTMERDSGKPLDSILR